MQISLGATGVEILRDPLNGAVETLTFPKKRGVTIGLISDGAVDVPLIWHETEFAELFDCTVFSCNIGASKPNPIKYQSACCHLSVESEDFVYVADGQSDELDGAIRVGMEAILICFPTEDTYEVHRSAVVESIECFREAESHVRGNQSALVDDR